MTYLLVLFHWQTARKSHTPPHKKQQNQTSPPWPADPAPGSLSHWGHDATAAASTSKDASSSDGAFAVLDGVILIRTHGRVPQSSSSGWWGISHLLLWLENTMALLRRPWEGKLGFVFTAFAFVLPELKMLLVAVADGFLGIRRLIGWMHPPKLSPPLAATTKSWHGRWEGGRCCHFVVSAWVLPWKLFRIASAVGFTEIWRPFGWHHRPNLSQH